MLLSSNSRLDLTEAESKDPNESRNVGHIMRMRKPPLFGFWTRLLAGLLAIGVVSSAWVWCQESDGRVNVEYGQNCSGLPDSRATGAATALSQSGEGCNSCIDIPVFVLGPHSGLSQNVPPLSLHGAAVALIESAPFQPSDLQSLFALSLDTHQINLTLSSVRSTILLI